MFHVKMFVLPEDQGALNLSEKAPDMYSTLLEIRQAFRVNRKYNGPKVTEEMFFDLLTDNGIDLDALSD